MLVAVTDSQPALAHRPHRIRAPLSTAEGFQGIPRLGDPCPHVASSNKPDPQVLELRIDNDLGDDRRLDLGGCLVPCDPQPDLAVQGEAQDILGEVSPRSFAVQGALDVRSHLRPKKRRIGRCHRIDAPRHSLII